MFNAQASARQLWLLRYIVGIAYISHISPIKFKGQGHALKLPGKFMQHLLLPLLLLAPMILKLHIPDSSLRCNKYFYVRSGTFTAFDRSPPPVASRFVINRSPAGPAKKET